MTITINIGNKFYIGLAIVVTFFVMWASSFYFSHSRVTTEVKKTNQSVSASTQEQEKYNDFLKIINNKGIKQAYDHLKKEYSNNQLGGHDMAHIIGRAAYEKMGQEGFSVCDTDFGFGCYHGLFDALIRKEGNNGMTGSVKGCESLGTIGGIASCIHGMGHGTLGYTGNIDEALEMCSQLKDDDKIYCYDGAYMEMFNSAMKDNVKAPALPNDDIWSFCKSKTSDSISQCIRNQIIYMLSSRAYTPEVAATACDKLDNENKFHCVINYGIFASQAANGDTAVVKGMCANFSTPSDQDSCLTNGAREFIFQNREYKLAEIICGYSSTENQNICKEEIKKMMRDYGKEI